MWRSAMMAAAISGTVERPSVAKVCCTVIAPSAR
jgi:hypothetical protein